MSKRTRLAICGIAGLVLAAGCAPAPPAGQSADTAAATPATAAAPVVLWGSAWRLLDLGGAGVLDRAPTLEFPDSGRVAGNASCNRYFGSVRFDGDSIHFSAMGSTRMACADDINAQEQRFLAALSEAATFTVEDSILFIASRNLAQPLRFLRTGP